jgi:ribosomal protein S18 acetylase RimI-like enzyme
VRDGLCRGDSPHVTGFIKWLKKDWIHRCIRFAGWYNFVMFELSCDMTALFIFGDFYYQFFLRKLETTGGTGMEFAKAAPSQTDEIFQVYKEATKIMNANNIYQWSENYPGREDIEKDIQSGNLYVLTSEGDIVACVVLDQHQEPEYEQIPWEDSSGRFLVVHRLCVNPKYQGKGISRTLLAEIERFAKKEGYASIRLDTQMINEKAMYLYESCGYEKRGKFYFPRHDEPYMAFEKRVT